MTKPKEQNNGNALSLDFFVGEPIKKIFVTTDQNRFEQLLNQGATIILDPRHESCKGFGNDDVFICCI